MQHTYYVETETKSGEWKLLSTHVEDKAGAFAARTAFAKKSRKGPPPRSRVRVETSEADFSHDPKVDASPPARRRK
jgi:hypothetical protein